MLFSHEKERNSAIYYNIDESGGHYFKWNKPDWKRKILYDVTFTWYLKESKSQNQRIEWWSTCAGDGGNSAMWFKGYKLPLWVSSGDRSSIIYVSATSRRANSVIQCLVVHQTLHNCIPFLWLLTLWISHVYFSFWKTGSVSRW